MSRQAIPSVDRLMRDPRLAAFHERLRARSAREAVAALRGTDAGYDDFAEAAVQAALRLQAPSLASAINLSGVVLHTGLGRARLAPAVAERVAEVARAHAAVELDLKSGKRGDRQTHVRELLRELTGAEDAHVVNNCAAGVFLGLAALCAGRDVLLSRGQMVEIGGSFRMPDIVRQSGCRLVELGCTNKTRLADYESALTPETAAVLRCHPSNFMIVGFAEEPAADELASFAHRHGLLMIDDVGSGCLVDTRRYGLAPEPTLTEAIRAGADLVMASGDKLLGGPQAGLLLGRREAIERIRRHPLARAVRVDKLTIAALEATLRLYRDGRENEIPVWRYLGRPLDEIRTLAERLADGVEGAQIASSQTAIGGGSLPGRSVPTWRVGLSGEPDGLAARLRQLPRPVIGRIEDGRLWLDPRTAEEDEVDWCNAALRDLNP
jgi:L-seryl-tRNA(Ser) seleniumtransferase